ncbi:DUF917 domain-containing protein [Brevibacillus fluminis]|uniref:DUF917 domain-containing protein n=1 Tax=Brevibacillus fluminis TaxID=511487 RepID=UPI003F8C1CDB
MKWVTYMQEWAKAEQVVTRDDLWKIVLGAAFFGSGGGGSIDGGKRLIEDILQQGKPISIISPSQVKPQQMGAGTAMLGSPSALKKATDLGSTKLALDELEKAMQVTFSFVMPMEVGPVNSLVPIGVAVRKNIPVADVDGAGRAVPELENTTFTAANIPVSPTALVNAPSAVNPQIKTILEIDTSSIKGSSAATNMETLARSIVQASNFGEMGGLATYPLNGSQLSGATIANTLTLAHYVGGIISQAVDSHQDPLPKVLAFLRSIGMPSYTFGTGRVIEVKKPSGQGGFDVGYVKVQNQSGDVLVINYQNESLFAYVNTPSNIWAMAPDLICYMTPTGPLTNVEIEEGLVVTVVGLPANYKMRQTVIVDSFLDVLKTLCGYDGPYIPIEKLHATGVEETVESTQ